MLSTNERELSQQTFPARIDDMNNNAQRNLVTPATQPTTLLTRAMRIEWLGQMAASMFWIASVLAYGIASSGDWLQILAASAWLVANVASLIATKDV